LCLVHIQAHGLATLDQMRIQLGARHLSPRTPIPVTPKSKKPGHPGF
jgi:hypothetical protein